MPKRRIIVAAIVLTLLVGAVVLVLTTNPDRPSRRLRELEDRLEIFQETVDRYTALEMSGELGTAPLFEQAGKVLIDRGPPLRIAFRDAKWGDNWGGFVYDPSGRVLEVGELRRAADAAGKPFDNRGAAQADPTGLGEIIMLFGGTMVGCEHLRGDWYWCAFN